jgi:hypothetical protein
MSLQASSIYAPKVYVNRVSQCLWGVHFKVVGDGEFPIDMLATDRCHPTSHVAASMIYGDRSTGLRTVELESWQRDSFWLPNIENWRVRGWTVVARSEEA